MDANVLMEQFAELVKKASRNIINDLKGEITGLKSDMDEMKRDIGGIKTQMQTMEKIVSHELKRDIAGIKTQMQTMEKIVSHELPPESPTVIETNKYFQAMRDAKPPELKKYRDYQYKLLEIEASIPMIVGVRHNGKRQVTRKTGVPLTLAVGIDVPIAKEGTNLVGMDVCAAKDVDTAPASVKKMPKTKILIRPCYERLYEKIVTAVKNGSGRIVIAGPPGVGKSFAFGGGFLVHKLMTDPFFKDKLNDTGIKHIVWTSTQGVSVVYNAKTNEVRVRVTQAQAYPPEALSPDTVWIMDNKEHGSFDSAQGIVILIASGKEENYAQIQKTNCKVFWLAAWDGRYDVGDITHICNRSEVPTEFLALCIECFGLSKDFPEDDELYVKIKRKFESLGPFPRDVLGLSEDTALARQERAIVDATAGNWAMYMQNGTLPTLARAPSMRLIYPLVDRKTLKRVPGGTSIASPAVENSLLNAIKKQQYWKVVETIIGQSQLSGSLNWNLGKAFEELIVMQFSKSGHVKRRILHVEKQTDEEKDHELPTHPIRRVDSFRSTACRSEPGVLYYSQNKNEPAVDAYIVKKRNDGSLHVYLFQITLNPDHDIQWKKLATLIRHIRDNLPKTTASIQFEYMFVTSAYQVRRFKSARKFTIKKSAGQKNATKGPLKKRRRMNASASAAASAAASASTDIPENPNSSNSTLPDASAAADSVSTDIPNKSNLSDSTVSDSSGVSQNNASFFKDLGMIQSVAYPTQIDISKFLQDETNDSHAKPSCPAIQNPSASFTDPHRFARTSQSVHTGTPAPIECNRRSLPPITQQQKSTS